MGKGPLMLLILDGFGLEEATAGNAIRAAETPNLDRLFAQYPHTTLGASGLDVGLPEGQMGNSEVGHTNIGAGRVVYQELTRITKSIKDGDFYKNPILLGAVERCKREGKALHLLGLLSDGGVHSHMEHLKGLLELCRREGLTRVHVHGFLDGRDVSPTSGKGFVEELLATMKALGVGTLASLCGRYYAMDRDNRWERVEGAYNALVLGEGAFTPDPVGALSASYEAGVTDEFFPPTCCSAHGKILEGDSVIFFNFRPDRARELTRAIVEEDFSGFVRKEGHRLVHYVCMTQYDSTIPGVEVAFPPQELHQTLGEVLAAHGKTQLRIAETEKYAHVTFFLNGGREEPYPGEARILIPSPKVATYDLQPEMSAEEVTRAVVEALHSPGYDVVILNFANCDMVGHTGVFSAAVRAVEAVDGCVGAVVDRVLALGGTVLLTADHGNADRMVEADGSPFTAHTTNPVPLLMAGGEGTLRPGILADIAPTMLQLLGLPIPPEMGGKSLLVHN